MSDYLPKNITNPIKIKVSAAPFLRIFCGMIEINPSPINTPIKVTKEKAIMAPVKTDRGCPVLEVMRIAANCVLSPNSARKIVPRVTKSVFKSIFLSPKKIYPVRKPRHLWRGLLTENVSPPPELGSLTSFLSAQWDRYIFHYIRRMGYRPD